MQGVQDKFDSFIKENKKVHGNTTFNKLKINSSASEITLLSTSFTRNYRHFRRLQPQSGPGTWSKLMLHFPWEGSQIVFVVNCFNSVDYRCFCSTGTLIDVHLNSAPYIIIHGVTIWGVRLPNIGTGVVVRIGLKCF